MSAGFKGWKRPAVSEKKFVSKVCIFDEFDQAGLFTSVIDRRYALGLITIVSVVFLRRPVGGGAGETPI